MIRCACHNSLASTGKIATEGGEAGTEGDLKEERGGNEGGRVSLLQGIDATACLKVGYMYVSIPSSLEKMQAYIQESLTYYSCSA